MCVHTGPSHNTDGVVSSNLFSLVCFIWAFSLTLSPFLCLICHISSLFRRRCRIPCRRLPILARALGPCPRPRIICINLVFLQFRRLSRPLFPRRILPLALYRLRPLLSQRQPPPRRRLLLLPRCLHDPGLRLPARVGLCGKQLDPRLAHELRALLLQRRGLAPRVPQPLVPFWADFYLRVVRRSRVGDDAAPALGGVLGAAGEAEFPKGVALEIKS